MTLDFELPASVHERLNEVKKSLRARIKRVSCPVCQARGCFGSCLEGTGRTLYAKFGPRGGFKGLVVLTDEAAVSLVRQEVTTMLLKLP